MSSHPPNHLPFITYVPPYHQTNFISASHLDRQDRQFRVKPTFDNSPQKVIDMKMRRNMWRRLKPKLPPPNSTREPSYFFRSFKTKPSYSSRELQVALHNPLLVRPGASPPKDYFRKESKVRRLRFPQEDWSQLHRKRRLKYLCNNLTSQVLSGCCLTSNLDRPFLLHKYFISNFTAEFERRRENQKEFFFFDIYLLN